MQRTLNKQMISSDFFVEDIQLGDGNGAVDVAGSAIATNVLDVTQLSTPSLCCFFGLFTYFVNGENTLNTVLSQKFFFIPRFSFRCFDRFSHTFI